MTRFSSLTLTLMIVLSCYLQACYARGIRFDFSGIRPAPRPSTTARVYEFESKLNDQFSEMQKDLKSSKRDSYLRRVGGRKVNVDVVVKDFPKVAECTIKIASIGRDLGPNSFFEVDPNTKELHLGLALFQSTTDVPFWEKRFELTRAIAMVQLGATDAWKWDPEHAKLSPTKGKVEAGMLEVDTQYTTDWAKVVEHASSLADISATFWALWGYRALTQQNPHGAGKNARYNYNFPIYEEADDTKAKANAQ
ncbi:hypothetical protein CVT24_010281 [Panaeolus cyanescens]|uniref:Uncharacterized protein n=1 Tax=Panaeolus cyanescens TaxID=181874 RepID=A0A409W916_9AGAR|nr:hypothetical protein CVT24_010281 [Panaeolus cyanescens]